MERYKLNVELAQMLKGGVIMDKTETILLQIFCSSSDISLFNLSPNLANPYNTGYPNISIKIHM